MMEFQESRPKPKRPTYQRRQTVVKFHDQYDATFSTLFQSDRGDFWVYRHMRCCFGSKVTIDTWMKPARRR